MTDITPKHTTPHHATRHISHTLHTPHKPQYTTVYKTITHTRHTLHYATQHHTTNRQVVVRAVCVRLNIEVNKRELHHVEWIDGDGPDTVGVATIIAGVVRRVNGSTRESEQSTASCE